MVYYTRVLGFMGHFFLYVNGSIRGLPRVFSTSRAGCYDPSRSKSAIVLRDPRVLMHQISSWNEQSGETGPCLTPVVLQTRLCLLLVRIVSPSART